MDEVIERLPAELMGHFSERDLGELIRLVEMARLKCQASAAPPTCDGKARRAKAERRLSPPFRINLI